MNIGNLLKTEMRNILSVTPFKDASPMGKFGNAMAQKMAKDAVKKEDDAIPKKKSKLSGGLGHVDNK